MEHPAISIIVPVYRVEAYLRRCLDSLLVQTYPNLQIILVDDGSPGGAGSGHSQCFISLSKNSGQHYRGFVAFQMHFEL